MAIDKRIQILQDISKRYLYMKTFLGKVDKSIQDKEAPDTIKAHYTKIKLWLEDEFAEFSKQKYSDSMYRLIYSHLLDEVFTKSLDQVSSDDEINIIQDAVINGLDNCVSWCNGFIESLETLIDVNREKMTDEDRRFIREVIDKMKCCDP